MSMRVVQSIAIAHEEYIGSFTTWNDSSTSLEMPNSIFVFVSGKWKDQYRGIVLV